MSSSIYKATPLTTPPAPTTATCIILPALLSTTASLSIAVYEHIFFTGLVKSSQTDKHSAARSISLWWKHSLTPGLAVVLSLGLTSLLSGVRAIRALGRMHFNGIRTSDSGSSLHRPSPHTLAILGTIFSASHFVFGPAIARVIQDMACAYDGLDSPEAKEEARSEVVDERVVEGQRTWLRLHVWRTLGVDLPAVLCFGWIAFQDGGGA